MKGFSFRRMFTSIPSFWSGTIKIPKHAKNITNWKSTPTKISSSYHHQECKNPGGSPNVMFFSHRIYNCGFLELESETIERNSPPKEMFVLPFVHQREVNIHIRITPTCTIFYINMITNTDNVNKLALFLLKSGFYFEMSKCCFDTMSLSRLGLLKTEWNL